MAVNTTIIVSGPYTGNAALDTYSYGFRVEDKTQVKVAEYTDLGVETILTVDVDYTVNGIGIDAGGTITRLAGNLPTDYQWIIRADYKTTQKSSLSSQGGFFPDIHEAAFDKLTFLIQQLQEELDRAVKVTIISGDNPDALIASIEASEAASAVSAAAALVSQQAALVSELAVAADLVLTNADVTYAAEWAKKAEDVLISVAAGGDGTTDYSALHHAAKAAISAATSADLATSVTGTDTYTSSPGVSSYVSGKTYYLSNTNPNLTSTPTINFDGLGAKSIKYMTGQLLNIGAIPSRPMLQYDGTDMLLLNPIADYPGKFAVWGLATPPINAFERDGSAISRTSYAALYARIGTTYGVGDGSTTFNIPDDVGDFERLWSNGSGRDPDAGSRTDRGDGTTGDNIGTKQSDQLKTHSHTVGSGSSNNGGGTVPFESQSVLNNSFSTNATGGNETRPRNTNVMPIIYY